MKEIFTLTKILMKKKAITNGKKKYSLGKFLLYLFVYGYIIFIMGFSSFQILSIAADTNISLGLVLNISFLNMFILIIFQSIISSLNLMYFSNDVEFLLPLPIKSYKIVIAKINCLLISQYIMEALIMGPFLIIMGIMNSFSYIYYLYSLLVLLLFPILPLIISILLITLVMKFTNIIKNKTFVQYFTIFLLFIFIFGIQFFVGANINDGTDSKGIKIVKENQELIENISKDTLIINQCKQILLNYDNMSSIKHLIILFAISTISFIVGTSIISKLYLKYVLEAKNKHLRGKNIKTIKIVESNIKKSYFRKELFLLIRNPVFFMQCLIPSIVFPLLILIPSYFTLKNDLEVLNMISNYLYTSVGFCIILGLLILLFMFNTCSITSISRDSKNAIFMKYIPVSLDKQIYYKSLIGIYLNNISIILLLVGLKIIMPNLNFIYLIMLFIIGYLVNVVNNYLMVIIDLKKPKNHWVNEYQVVKQNSNIGIQFVILMIEILVIFVLSVAFNNLVQCLMLIFILNILILMIIKKYINKNKVSLFSKIN